MLVKDQAICLRVMEYSETSQIVTLMTRSHGKIQAIAKGARRAKSAFDGPIERFSRGDVVYLPNENSSLYTLREFRQVYDVVMMMSRCLEAYHCALLGTELLTKLTHEHDPHETLFDAFVQFLQNLGVQSDPESARRHRIALLIIFQLSLLRDIGMSPVLSECLNCQAPSLTVTGQVYFSHGANGIVCRDCEMNFPDRVPLSKDVISCLAKINLLANMPISILMQIEALLVDHFSYLLHTRPKTAKWVLELA